MRILLTGHDGYIGAVKSQYLLDGGHEVVGLGDHIFEGRSFGEYHSPAPSLRHDIREVARKDLEGSELRGPGVVRGAIS